MKLLALVLLLSAFSSLTLMEVVRNFEQCSEFFIRSPNQRNIITPTVFQQHQYKKICQRWENISRFATLYDTERRIPVYSAYKYTGSQNSARSEEWKNEPQLENRNDNQAMIVISPAEMETYSHQAVDRDYAESSVYTRGHVFPRLFASDQAQADSTFTFTNIAPQTPDQNNQWEQRVEGPMKNYIQEMCSPSRENPTYIVTGVVPGHHWIAIRRQNREKPQGVNIPGYYWAAFCCYTNHGQIISKAYLATMVNFNVRNPSMANLTNRLSELYGQSFSVFPGTNCEN